MSHFKDLQELEDQGIDLIEVLGQDRHLESPEALAKIIERLSGSGDNLYAELLYYLTYRRFSGEQAESLWRGIMKHKARMGEALGRQVPFRVAALDYLSSRNVLLRNVRLIAKAEFESILSYVNVDDVTGVFNRRYFNDVLTQELYRARRYESPLSLLILDIDEFKRVNDALGHVEGDAVLRKMGRLLRDSTRQPDSVCRYGGDEFAVVLPQTSKAKAGKLSERIRKEAARVPCGQAPETARWPALLRTAEEGREPQRREPPRITVSIGGATYPTDCEEAEELVAIADQRCLDAKRRGKNRVVLGGDEAGGISLAAE